MLGLLLHELAATERRLRVDKFIRTESSTALLALVTICTLCTATWTCSCNIAVCKKGLCLLIIVLFAHLLDELAFVIKFLEEIGRILMMGL